ncbi:MAG TPA: hypothetical protein PK904_15340 [Bacteroidales bacterium]|nr:hypothetical protein [Bacteroidales bacterium]
MKKAIKYIAVLAIAVMTSVAIQAQTPPHPSQNGNGSNVGGGPVGGAAPIDGGLSLLLLAGAAYGARKVYKIKKDDQ